MAPSAHPLLETTTIDAIVAALYRCISGAAGAPRNWALLFTLFHPGARLLRAGMGETGAATLQIMTIEEFARVAEPYFREHAFYERELARRTERFGQIAHVWSTYGAYSAPDVVTPLGRGINSIQLWFDGARWWVMSMLWDDERPGSLIATQYLPRAGSDARR
jgi:hypothetical protein